MTISNRFATIYDNFCPVPFLPSPGFIRVLCESEIRRKREAKFPPSFPQDFPAEYQAKFTDERLQGNPCAAGTQWWIDEIHSVTWGPWLLISCEIAIASLQKPISHDTSLVLSFAQTYLCDTTPHSAIYDTMLV